MTYYVISWPKQSDDCTLQIPVKLTTSIVTANKTEKLLNLPTGPIRNDLASLDWVIRYTGTGNNNSSKSFQVSTSKPKSKLDKFTISGLGQVYESNSLETLTVRLLHLNCSTNPCHI